MTEQFHFGEETMYRVKKRDGNIVEFDLSKILHAVQAAYDATGTHYNSDVLDL